MPYLHDLGISHIYASPIFQAAPGSMHGYDVADHNQLNPELGSREDFDAYIAELRRYGMQQILDFVPNHMGIAEAINTWWMDVLENGPSSPYARFFDIDWHPIKRELENKVLLPILGDHYGRVLESGDLKLHFKNGAFFLDYYGRQLPISPRTTQPLLEGAKEQLRSAGAEIPVELESILVALEHLPPRTETDPEKLMERAREKEVIKTRLVKLCEERPEVEAAIRETIAEVQSGGKEKTFDAYDALIRAQPYRLAYWRVASEEINYRRFFDINTLAAIRMELPEVFETTHRLVFDLLREGAAVGLRIDHVDGLWEPRGYLSQLQERFASITGTNANEKPLYLLVEKILGKGEHLRSDWPTHGTTGYEVAVQLASVLVDSDAEKAFSDIYAKFTGSRTSYADLVYRSKLLTMRASMASEVNVLGQMLSRISETNPWYCDFTLNALTTAIREVIACFPVYRTYITPDGTVAEEDKRVILRAIAAARRRNPAMERTVFEFLRDVLTPPPDNPHPVDEEARLQFVMKFQQCTGPITAKGVEDTAFYVYNRLVALNEVGGEPAIFGESIETFHKQNEERLASFPESMVTTSTHDTTRSEDVRARIAALSELPQEWSRVLRGWQSANRKHRIQMDGEFAPDANEEYLLYQILLGSWPLEPMSPEEHAVYVKRIQEYMGKALHEAKVNSSWVEPNVDWDNAVNTFVGAILAPKRGNRFLKSLEPFARRLSELGMINSLTQTVLKLTVPGVPDIYQGQETWDFSLVDPDNRRPVNYETRRQSLALLQQAPAPAELLQQWRDGRIKLFITHKLLLLRREHPDLFRHGNYTPVTVEGAFGQCCIAFRREYAGKSLLVVTSRLSSRVGTPPVGDCWGDTRLATDLSREAADLFTGNTLAAGGTLMLRDVLRELPVAVYVSTPA